MSSEKGEKVTVLGPGILTGRRIGDSGEEGELKRALQARRGSLGCSAPSSRGHSGYSEPGVDDVFRQAQSGKSRGIGEGVLGAAVLG